MLERHKNEFALLETKRSSDRDRRVAQRYPAGGTEILITWSIDGQYQSITAQLKDISLSGVAALAKTPPPTETPLWLRLRNDTTSEWIGALLVGISKTGMFGRGPRLVRLKFCQACPYQVFKAAIEGFSQEVKCDDPALGTFTRRDWR